VLLLERAGEMVTRDELRQKVWPSRVYVDFKHGLDNAIVRLRNALGDTAGNARFIETLPRLGYRFICPVEKVAAAAQSTVQQKAADIDTQPTGPIPPGGPAPQSLGRRLSVTSAIVGTLAVLAVLAGLWIARHPADEAPTATFPLEPSIAVLPFVNMSDDAEKEHFADGLSEEVLH
jgi:hypothetical protein